MKYKVQFVVFWHGHVLYVVLYAHVECCLFLLYSNEATIFSVIYIKYVYNAFHHMVNASDFICAIPMCIHLPYMHVKYLA